ncbi:MAG: asparagine synthase (glutamine-hydrolyzing) [Filifactoraceae bacterium]
MCGIVGFINKDSKEVKTPIIQGMMDKIYHRGPDSCGHFADDTVALGFRRLSIIDLEGGMQPIYNEDKSLVIIFNGEIYNFQEIKHDLITKGHIFSTHTDTEVILHGYEEYGKSILDKLRGMFAFVIYNINTKEVFGARDIFGIKPFYYGTINDTFFFGSEIKSFLPHPSFKKELNKTALKPYLTFQYNPLEETFFKGIFKLPPGSYFTLKNGEFKNTKYYDFEFNVKDDSFENTTKKIDELLRESVNYHKISDVPVGSFLSSGIDSSYITSILRPDKTFTVGFENKAFNEIDSATSLSSMLNIENVNTLVSPEDFFDNLKDIEYYSDEAHANLSAVPLYFLSKLTKEYVTVILSGEGADELFGGYYPYLSTQKDLNYQKIPYFLRYTLGKMAVPFLKGTKKNFIIRNSFKAEEYYIGQAKIFEDYDVNNFLQPNFQSSLTSKEITAPYFEKVKDKDELTKKLYLDMVMWLPNDILLKADKMTMAHSIELRVPFLDKVMFEYASSIKNAYKINTETTKLALRKASYDCLPKEWSEREKIGFPVPFSKWIQEKKYYDIVLDTFRKEYVGEIFDQDKIISLLEEHYQNTVNNGRKIYTIFAFIKWYEAYFI